MKKIHGYLLVGALAFSLFAVLASSIDHKEAEKAEAAISNGQLYVGGVDINTQTNKRVSGGSGYAQLSGTTLTLNNYTYNGAGYAIGSTYKRRGSILYLGSDDLTINVVGTNTITTDDSSMSFRTYGIGFRPLDSGTSANLTFTGSGTLNVTSGKGTVSLGLGTNTDGTINFNGPNVTLSGPKYTNASSGYSYGFSFDEENWTAAANVSAGTVQFIGDIAKYSVGCGIYALNQTGGDLTIQSKVDSDSAATPHASTVTNYNFTGGSVTIDSKKGYAISSALGSLTVGTGMEDFNLSGAQGTFNSTISSISIKQGAVGYSAVNYGGTATNIPANSDKSSYTSYKSLKLVKVISATATGYSGAYDGNAHSISVSVTKPSSGATVKYGTTSGSCTLSSAPTYTNVGTYTTYYQVSASGYETLAGSETVTITKANPTYTAPSAKTNLKYTGSAQALINAGVSSHGTFTYKLSTESSYGSSVPTATLPGSYTVDWKLTGDSNHNDASGSVAVSIGKAYLTNAGVTVTSDPFAYDGTPKTPTISTSGETVTGGSPTFLYSTEEDGSYTSIIPSYIDAGTHTIYWKATADYHEDATGTFDFTINPGTIENVSVTVTSGPFTYDGTPKSPTLQVSGTTPTVEPQFTYSTEESGVYSTEVPSFVEPGNHTIYWKVSAPNYVTQSGSISFTINPADMTDVSVTVTSDPFVYDGSAKAPVLQTTGETVTGEDPTFTYSKEEAGVYSEEIPTFTDAGTHTIYWKANATGHNEVTGSIQFTINKADSSYSVIPSAKTGLEYTGSAQKLVNAGTAIGGTLKYSTDGETYSTEIPTATAAGGYTVYYKIFADGNHNDSVVQELHITIAKADYDTLVSITGWTYGEDPNSPSVSYNPETGAVTYEYKLKSASEEAYTTTVPTNAGEYTLRATIAETANYQQEVDTIDFVIAKSDSSVTSAPTIIDGLVYTGNPQELVNAGSASGGTLKYSLDGENYSESIPSATNAGNYIVYYKVFGDDNHNDTAVEELHVSIAKAAAVLTAPTAKEGLHYNGEDQALVNAGSTTFGEVLYKINDGEYSIELPKAKNVGTYTVYYKVESTDNYDGVAEASLTVTIEANNKDSLVDKIDEANVYLSEMGDDYPIIKQELLDAINAANQINDNPNVTVSQINQAVEDLNNAINKAKGDTAAVENVINLIDEIGEVSYPGSESAINDARQAYNDLDDELKAYIENYQDLVDAEKVYDHVDAVADLIKDIPDAADSQEYYDAVDTAKAAYDALTDKEKEVLANATDYNYVKTLDDNVAAREVIELIGKIGDLTYDGGQNDSLKDIKKAEDAYAKLTDDQKVLVEDVNYDVLTKDRADYDKLDDLVKDINDVEHIVYGDGDDIDDLRDRYDALDDYLKGIFPEDTLQHLEDLEEAYKVIVEIHDIAPLTYDVECLDKIELAFESYDDLTDTQKALVSNYDDLLKYKADYDAVDDLVKQIEAVTSIQYGDQDKIKNLRDAYDALTDDQKAFFPEDTLQHLVDLEKAYGVIVNIHDIAPVEYTPECLEKIETARTNYDALTQTQKDLVSNYSDLVDAEKVYDAMDKISSIGEVEYSSESEELIKEAKEAYDALTDEQKEMLEDKYKTTLDIAIKNYESKKEGSNVLVIIFIILASLALVGGGLFLFFFYKKKKDDKDDDDSSNGKGKKEPVKAMSLAVVPAILVSYYLTGPYVALYVIGGLALIVWIFILVVVILKKKGINLFKKDEPVKKAKEETKPVEEKKVIETKVNSDGDEIVVTKDSKGNIFEIRFIKSFTAKIIQASDEMKKYYEELKNEALSYKNTTSRTSWHFDSVNSGRNQVMKFAVRGKTLCVYFALNADEYNDSKYKVEKVESKKFEEVPCLYRIKNDRRLGYAKELIEVVMKKFSLQKGKEQHESYILPYEENKPLIERGLIKEVTVQVSRQEEPEVIEKKVNADGDEIVVTRDSHGDFYEIRYVKSFTAKLSQGEKDTRNYYNILKNYVLSHKNANSRVSWRYDAINVGRKQILRFSIRGKTLCVYYDLNADDYKDTKYKVEKVETKKFEEVPCLYRIKNDRRLGYAKDLIDDLMKKFGVSKGKESNEDFLVPYESTQVLLKKDLIRESKSKVSAPQQEVHKSITVEEADEKMTDAAAEAKISIDTSSKKHEGKRAILNIDTIAENFNDGDVVDLEALWEKKLIAKNVGYVKVLARGQLDKKLNLDLQDYSIQAVKMVLLEGGTVKRAK